jgi:hypothetical protein
MDDPVKPTAVIDEDEPELGIVPLFKFPAVPPAPIATKYVVPTNKFVVPVKTPPAPPPPPLLYPPAPPPDATR